MHDESTTESELETRIDRLNSIHADSLTDETPEGETVEFHLYIDSWNDGTRRVRVSPKNIEHGSWVSDLGPAFNDIDELKAFLRGLEFADDIDHKARYME